MRYLTCEEYEKILRSALAQHGLRPKQADNLIRARWPLAGHVGCMNEASGRGLLLDEGALRDFLAAEFAEHYPDAPEVESVLADLTRVAVAPALFERFLEWCVEHNRCRHTDNGRKLAEHPEAVDEMTRRAASRMN